MSITVAVSFICSLITSLVFCARALYYQYPEELYIAPSEAYIPSMSPSYDSSNTPSSYPLAPALFVIGDSSVDSGTNNFLGTFARANHPPYGRDFDSRQATGRFCNGRIPVDYLGHFSSLSLLSPFTSLCFFGFSLVSPVILALVVKIIMIYPN